MAIKFILIALIAITLTGCGSITRVFEVDTTPIERPKLELPEVDQFNPKDVQWIVVTEENVQQVLKDLESQNIDVALFALTDEGYQNLSLNMANIIKLIQQQNAIIAAYKNYYESQDEGQTQ